MRKTLLEAIYLGYYLPAEKVSGGAEYEEYHEATAEASEVYERFKEKLDSEQVKTLEQVLEANEVASSNHQGQLYRGGQVWGSDRSWNCLEMNC